MEFRQGAGHPKAWSRPRESGTSPSEPRGNLQERPCPPCTSPRGIPSGRCMSINVVVVGLGHRPTARSRHPTATFRRTARSPSSAHPRRGSELQPTSSDAARFLPTSSVTISHLLRICASFNDRTQVMTAPRTAVGFARVRARGRGDRGSRRKGPKKWASTRGVCSANEDHRSDARNGRRARAGGSQLGVSEPIGTHRRRTGQCCAGPRDSCLREYPTPPLQLLCPGCVRSAERMCEMPGRRCILGEQRWI
jgi:hypothetical protein